MQHDHSSHEHSAHVHGPADYRRAFAIGIALNVAYVAAEAIAGVVSRSLALLAAASLPVGERRRVALKFVRGRTQR
jgi:cobalt-zinc-cadmium efflux system protein